MMAFARTIVFWAAEPTETQISWWVILLIIFVILALLIWLLTRKSAKDDQPVKMATRHPDGAPAQPPAPVIPDDLKIIEGIGPKIVLLLKQAGIVTFKQLARTDAAKLREIMNKANLRITDPTTWPEQARLAAEGKKGELKALQDSLRAGRKV